MMIRLVSVLSCCLCYLFSVAQVTVEFFDDTPSVLEEISGMTLVESADKPLFVAINDSGNPAELHLLEADFDSPKINHLQAIPVVGATNVDWECLAANDTHIFIGDTGNNSSGNRTDLTIYAIKRPSDWRSITQLDVDYSIKYSYEDQINFAAQAGNSTRFDCEAIQVRDNDSLILFTKNWLTDSVYVYGLTITPGVQVATLSYVVPHPWLVTDSSNKLLSGYNQEFECFLGIQNDHSSPTSIDFDPQMYSMQIEALASIDTTTYLVASEERKWNGFGLDGGIWIIQYDPTISGIKIGSLVSHHYNFRYDTLDRTFFFEGLPAPTTKRKNNTIELFSSNGQPIMRWKTSDAQFSATLSSDLPQGTYYLHIRDTKSRKSTQTIPVVSP